MGAGGHEPLGGAQGVGKSRHSNPGGQAWF